MQKTVQAIKLNDKMKTAQKSFSHHWKKTSTLTWTNTLKKTNLQFRGHCVSFYNLWKQQQHAYKERPFLVRMVKLWWKGWGGGIAKVSYATKFLYFYHYSWSQIKNIFETKATSGRWPEGGWHVRRCYVTVKNPNQNIWSKPLWTT